MSGQRQGLEAATPAATETSTDDAAAAAAAERQLTAREEQELRAMLELLTYEGRQVDGTSPEVDPDTLPECYEPERFRRAQKTVNKYYVSVSMASSVGLLLLLQLDEILLPLLKTGKSRTVALLYERYSATAKYIKRMYESNFLERDTDGWRYITLVRSMHKRAHQLLNSAECEHAPAKPKCRAQADGTYLWVNQYDMALTQFAFVGLFVLRPDKCGAHRTSAAEMSDICYYWRLISRQLGIEERFNIFVYHDEPARQRRLMSLLLDHYKVKLQLERDPLGVSMARGFLLSFEDMATEASFAILEHHWLEVISLSGAREPAPYEGFGEHWKLLRFKFILKMMRTSDLALAMMNVLYKRKLVKFCNKGDKMKRKLARKYPGHVYEMSGLEMGGKGAIRNGVITNNSNNNNNNHDNTHKVVRV